MKIPERGCEGGSGHLGKIPKKCRFFLTSPLISAYVWSLPSQHVPLHASPGVWNTQKRHTWHESALVEVYEGSKMLVPPNKHLNNFRLRLDASAAMGRLASIARRNPASARWQHWRLFCLHQQRCFIFSPKNTVHSSSLNVSRRRAYQRRLRYNKTVLYVITAWVDDRSVPRLHHSAFPCMIKQWWNSREVGTIQSSMSHMMTF